MKEVRGPWALGYRAVGSALLPDAPWAWGQLAAQGWKVCLSLCRPPPGPWAGLW